MMSDNYPDIYNIYNVFDTHNKEGFKGISKRITISAAAKKEKACRDRGYATCNDEEKMKERKEDKPVPKPDPEPENLDTTNYYLLNNVPGCKGWQSAQQTIANCKRDKKCNAVGLKKDNCWQKLTETRILAKSAKPINVNKRYKAPPVIVRGGQADTENSEEMKQTELDMIEHEKRKKKAENELDEWKTNAQFASAAAMNRREAGIKRRQDIENENFLEQKDKMNKKERERQNDKSQDWERWFKESRDTKRKDVNNKLKKQKNKFNKEKRKHKKILRETVENAKNAKEEWESYKTAFCPGPGTYSVDELNDNSNVDINYDVNRYTNIETETKSTYDLLKRSEICTAINNNKLIEKYKTKVDTEQDILKREHSDLLRYYAKFMNDIQEVFDDQAEQSTNTTHTGKNEINDNINKRKSYYQSVQSQERKWYIRLIEIIYIVLLIIMTVSLFLKPDISILKKVVTIMLFCILPYFTFNYLIHWIQFIRNYILRYFNVYDSVYNHVK